MYVPQSELAADELYNIPSATPDNDTPSDPKTMSVSDPMTHQPVVWWVGLLAVFIGLIVVSRMTGAEEQYRHLRVSIWNLVLLTIGFVVVINALKVLFTKYHIPGLSKLVQNV